MKDIVLLGAGKIGRMVAHFLGTSGDYRVRVADVDKRAAEALCVDKAETCSPHGIDFSDGAALRALMKGAWAVISCAPFHCNPLIAEIARAEGLHYLDLTEDVAVTRKVEELAKGANTAFIPQCGLAPGFITIVANDLVTPMTDLQDVRMRVGALSRFPSNRLKYNLTWSTEGIINEYCHPCEVVKDGEFLEVQPLENLERLTIDGIEYEAFNTSGGLGTFAATLKGRARNVNYKSMRYPGHNEILKILLHDLQLKDHRDELKVIFERALPTTEQDQIVIYASATGTYQDRFTERTYATTIYDQDIDGKHWTGIQITTAAGICAVLDLLREGKLSSKGFVRQEDVGYQDFIQNRFGRYYA